MTKKKIIHEGKIIFGKTIIPCYVLENGARVLSGNDMQNALNLQEDTDNKSGTRLARYLNQKSLKKFLYQGKERNHYEPMICYKVKNKNNSYEATVLADVCDAFLEARKSIDLSPRQKIIADQCEILIKGFARVGSIALVDQATGYQYESERLEIQKILNAYVSEEVLKWQLTFTDEFYKLKLWGISFVPKYIERKLSFIEKPATKYIYEGMPKGVLETIKEKTSKTEAGNYKYRWHQSLTPNIGREHLKKQILEVTTLMEISKSKVHFNSLFE